MIAEQHEGHAVVVGEEVLAVALDREAVALGLIESLTALWFGPEYAVPISFALLVAFLAIRPTGLLGRRGYE